MVFFLIPPNVDLTAGEAGPVRPGLRLACVTRRVFLSGKSLSLTATRLQQQQNGKLEADYKAGTG